MKASRLWGGVLTLAVAGLILTTSACGGGDSKATPAATTRGAQPTASATRPAAAATAAGGTTVRVRLTEFNVTPDRRSIPAGNVTLEIKNDGALQHELIIHRYDGTKREEFRDIGEIGAGETKTVTVNIPPGEYELACEVGEDTPDSHYEKGMHTDVVFG